jgi:uncharacterized paraquat-inducible protein A
MSPHSLIDVARLLDRIQSQRQTQQRRQQPTASENAPASTACATQKCVLLQGCSIVNLRTRKNKRREQIEALVAGTLFFLPFLIAYFVTCGNQ